MNMAPDPLLLYAEQKRTCIICWVMGVCCGMKGPVPGWRARNIDWIACFEFVGDG